MEPEDLDLKVKIGTSREVFLTKLKKALEQELETCTYTAEVNRDFLAVVDKQIVAEQAKMQKQKV